MTTGGVWPTVSATMRSWVAWARWGHLTLALSLLLAAAPPAFGQQPVTYVYDALGRLVAVVDPATNGAAIYRYDAVGNLLSIARQPASQVAILEFPPQGTPGTCGLRILGVGFHATPSQNTVTINGVGATVESASTTELVVCVPATVTTGAITVTTPSSTGTSETPFTVAMSPSLTLSYLGFLRDRVRPSASLLTADGVADGTFQLTLATGSGDRVVTQLELRRDATNAWDTVTGNSLWILGVAGSLDGPLLNTATGRVNAPVAEGGGLYLFGADTTPSVFVPGATFTLTATFSDGAVATALATAQLAATVTSVSPSAGAPGATLTVTITGSNFPAGAAVSFGAGITVNSTTVNSATQLTANVTIATTATYGARDVTVTGPGVAGTTKVNGFTVTPMTLSYLGKLRDKVRQSETVLTPDGVADGTFDMRVKPGTITQLVLANGQGTWDTLPGNGMWALGVTNSPDGTLLNSANGSVNILVAGGETFSLFGADLINHFAAGTVLTLTARFSDGTSAAASATAPPAVTVTSVSPSAGPPGATLTVTITGSNFPTGAAVSFGAGITVNSTTVNSATQLTVNLSVAATATYGARDVVVTGPGVAGGAKIGGFTVTPLTLSYLGKLRDRVQRSETALAPDGAVDGTFQVAVAAGTSSMTITQLVLQRTGSGTWDTIPANAMWALGAARTLDDALLNSGNGAVNFAVAGGDTFNVFGADSITGTLFGSGTSFTLKATFSDGGVATAAVTIGP